MTDGEGALGFSYEELLGKSDKKESADKKPPEISNENKPEPVDIKPADKPVEKPVTDPPAEEKTADSPDEEQQELSEAIIGSSNGKPHRSPGKRLPSPDLVLSKYRDPWTNWSETHFEKAKWVADYFQRLNRQIHERGFHYWLVSLGDVVKPDGTPYSNTEKDWNTLLQWVKWAKYLKIGDWTNLIDRKHPDPIDHLEFPSIPGALHTEGDSPDKVVDAKLKGLIDSIIEEIMWVVPRYEILGYQNYFLAVFCEKSSMNSYISPVVEQFNGVFQPLVGESSLERVEAIARKAAELKKPVRIFYISDFDPSGEQMPVSVARKVEWFAREKYKLAFDVKLRPIVLNYDQVVRYRLPGIPTKEGDSRAKGFIERNGDRATELDALEALYPGELASIIRKALEPYYDRDNPVKVMNENDRIAKVVREMLEGIRPKLDEALSGLKVEGLESLDLKTSINADFQPPKPDHYVDDSNDGWLLDTSRDYSAQLDYYRKWKLIKNKITPEQAS
jgi:hypothetical protein